MASKIEEQIAKTFAEASGRTLGHSGAQDTASRIAPMFDTGGSGTGAVSGKSEVSNKADFPASRDNGAKPPVAEADASIRQVEERGGESEMTGSPAKSGGRSDEVSSNYVTRPEPAFASVPEQLATEPRNGREAAVSPSVGVVDNRGALDPVFSGSGNTGAARSEANPAYQGGNAADVALAARSGNSGVSGDGSGERASGSSEQLDRASVLEGSTNSGASGVDGGGGNAGELLSQAFERAGSTDLNPATSDGVNRSPVSALDQVFGAANSPEDAAVAGADSGTSVTGSPFVSGGDSPGGETGASSSYSSGSQATGSSGGGGIGSTIESIATTVLEGGLGVIPLVGKLLGLFGGGSSAPAPLEKYSMPSPISFEAAETGNGLSASDYDQTGQPRSYDPSSAGLGQNADATSGGASQTANGGSQSTAAGGSGQQITVNVQAMDAQSFMTYSSQIAQAVRDAMLNSSSINDVISEL